MSVTGRVRGECGALLAREAARDGGAQLRPRAALRLRRAAPAPASAAARERQPARHHAIHDHASTQNNIAGLKPIPIIFIYV